MNHFKYAVIRPLIGLAFGISTIATAQTITINEQSSNRRMEAKPEDSFSFASEVGPDTGVWESGINANAGGGLSSPYAVTTQRSELAEDMICGQGTGASAFAYSSLAQRTTGQSAATSTANVVFTISTTHQFAYYIKSRVTDVFGDPAAGAGSLTGPGGIIAGVGFDDTIGGIVELTPGEYTLNAGVNGGATCIANVCNVRNSGNWQILFKPLATGIPGASEQLPLWPDSIEQAPQSSAIYVSGAGAIRQASEAETWVFSAVSNGEWLALIHPRSSTFSLPGGGVFTTITLPSSGITGTVILRVGQSAIQATPGAAIDFSQEFDGSVLTMDSGMMGVESFTLEITPEERCGEAALVAIQVEHSRPEPEVSAALVYGNPWIFRNSFEF